MVIRRAGGVLLCFVLAVAGVQLKCGKDHDCGMLPDFDDPQVARHMKCGSCQLVVTEIANKIIRREADLKKLTEDQATVMLEEFCEKEITEFGLQLDENGRPLPKFTNDPTLNRAQGGWVKRQLQGICGEVVGDFEEQLLGASTRFCTATPKEDGSTILNCDTKPMAANICFDQFKYCSKKDKKAYLKGGEVGQGGDSTGTQVKDGAKHEDKPSVPEPKTTDVKGADSQQKKDSLKGQGATGVDSSSPGDGGTDEEVVTLTLPGFKNRRHPGPQTTHGAQGEAEGQKPERSSASHPLSASEGTCSPEEWEIYGKLMDVDDLRSLRCEQFQMEVCRRCRGDEDCTSKAKACGVREPLNMEGLRDQMKRLKESHTAEMKALEARQRAEIQALEKEIQAAAAV